MAGWHHQFNGLELEQALGGSEGQEAWHAAVHGVARVRHDLVTGQQQQQNQNERGDTATDITEILIQSIREYQGQLHTNKLDNLEAIDNFLEIH